jgi:hypothetical protein
MKKRLLLGALIAGYLIRKKRRQAILNENLAREVPTDDASRVARLRRRNGRVETNPPPSAAGGDIPAM